LPAPLSTASINHRLALPRRLLRLAHQEGVFADVPGQSGARETRLAEGVLGVRQPSAAHRSSRSRWTRACVTATILRLR
jgi:hypothetical protein